jgi:hypothetical protein
MTQLTLEERGAALEHQLAEIRAAEKWAARPKDWRRTIGIFTGDTGMQQLFDGALKLCEVDRARARRRQGKSRRAKS